MDIQFDNYNFTNQLILVYMYILNIYIYIYIYIYIHISKINWFNKEYILYYSKHLILIINGVSYWCIHICTKLFY